MDQVKGSIPVTRFITVLIILVVGASLAQSAISQDTRAWLPIKKSEFIKLYAEKLNLPLKALTTLDALLIAKRRELRSKPRRLHEAEEYLANSRKFIAPGETLWLPGKGNKGNILFVVAGSGDRIHSFRVTVGLGSMLEDDVKRTLSFLSALYEKIYPDWSEAADWPLGSVGESWKITAGLIQGDQAPPSVRHQTSWSTALQ
jgi:hypothetical protein